MMGKFSNESPGVGLRIATPLETSGTSGFDAMGKPVPLYRQQAAYNHCKAMGMTDKEAVWDCVRGMVNKLERDEPALAMEHGIKYLNAIGVYRLMAVLLAEERAPEATEPTEWDFAEAP
jgi:hypothetical protein